MDSSGNKTNNIVSVDKFGNISLLDIGKTTLKVTLGSDDTLVKYSVYIDLTIDRDISVMFSSLAKKLRKLVGHYLLFAVLPSSQSYLYSLPLIRLRRCSSA